MTHIRQCQVIHYGSKDPGKLEEVMLSKEAREDFSCDHRLVCLEPGSKHAFCKKCGARFHRSRSTNRRFIRQYVGELPCNFSEEELVRLRALVQDAAKQAQVHIKPNTFLPTISAPN